MTDVADNIIPSFVFKVEQDKIARIAAILRDPNPIHLDAGAVRAAGLGDRPINQGPANLAYAVNMLVAAFPDHRISEISSRFLANVFVDDVITATGEVVSNENTEIVCAFRVANGEGQEAVVGKATLVIRKELP